MEPISISALNRFVKDLLDNNEALCDLVITAELASFHLHRKSGHCYFILKDSESSVKAVMFSRDADRLSFVPEDGMQLLVRARATLYQKDGSFQLYVTHMFLDGEGALNAAFLKTKQRLEQRGFFDPSHKKPLPDSPACIGLVTSKDGAALQDILAVVRRRTLKSIRFILFDTPVQGATAADPIAQGIRALDRHPDVELILVTRGGGSAEDLFVFNSEVIAEAIYNAEKPVVSAIGHEIDLLISDLVADVRAATPTAAAEIVLIDPSQLLYRYKVACGAIDKKRIASAVNMSKQRLSDVAQKLQDTTKSRVERARLRLNTLGDRLTAFDPNRVLKKGYAVIRREQKPLGELLPNKGDHIELETKEAFIECLVENVSPKTL